jgi:hypothetical protein
MKINILKNLIVSNRTRCSLALLATLVSIWFALVPGAAQSKSQKRITGLQISEGGEGARVTIFSDSLLNDYEAFRRGDRFYVRIPLADFTSGKPGFQGDGFDDVQVQKVGDSVVVSFKLQPGASARVDQHSNKLEVIFSAPNRMARGNRTNLGASRVAAIPSDGIVRAKSPQTIQPRQRDAAGPMPPNSPDTPRATRERLANERTSDFSVARNQPVKPAYREESRRGNSPTGTIGTSTSTFRESSPTTKAGQSPASSSPTQTSGASKAGSSVSKYEPSPVVTSSTVPSYPSYSSSTPATPVASPSSAKTSVLNGSQSGKSRSDIALQWVKANRQASLVGGLLALLLLVFLVAFLLRRRKNVERVRRTEKALAQPKQSAVAEAGTPAASAPVVFPASNVAAAKVVNEKNGARTNSSELNPMTMPVAPANGARTNGSLENTQRVRGVQEQAVAQSAAAATKHAWTPVTPSQNSAADEDPEREVFEL